MFEKKIREKTIKDFDEQWKLQGELNKDYWSSDQILFDQFSTLFSANEVTNKVIGEVGAGTGRVLKTLFKYNPKKVYAIEPSKVGVSHILENLKKHLIFIIFFISSIYRNTINFNIIYYITSRRNV